VVGGGGGGYAVRVRVFGTYQQQATSVLCTDQSSAGVQ